MEAQFHALPPLKRFRLLQQQQNQQEEHQKSDQAAVVSSQLPSKKRKESRAADSLPFRMSSTNYCLPAKKRVWALQPDSISGKPLFPIDLNVEYQPFFKEENEEKREKIPVVENADFGIESSEVEDKENKDPVVEQIKESNKNTECLEDAEKVGRKEEEGLEEDDGIVCAICQSTDGDPSDPIVFCDGCDLMVHATCYGNPLIKGIPEGDWFCTQCSVSQSSETENNNTSTFSCCLCPLKGGALKPTKNGRWAHIVCALFVPEVFFEDPEGRERIDCSEIPKRRWNQRCYVCKSKRGCAIECSEPRCPLGFHVTCGLKEDLYIEYREGKKKGAIVAGFCKHHTQIWEKQQQTGKFKIVARDEENK